MDGFLTTQLLYVAASLDVADLLASGPRTGPEVAEAVGADPDLLTRVLRGLAMEEVLEEVGGAVRPHRARRVPAPGRGRVDARAGDRPG